MLTLGEIDLLERRLKAAIVARSKLTHGMITLVEVIDEADLWPAPLETLEPLAPTHAIERLIERAPAFICAVASEVGFRFEGVGTVFWAKLETALGLTISYSQRNAVGEAFAALANKYRLVRPSNSQFSEHFSIIAWPIANALLPVDLVSPVTRLLARGPVHALPGRGRALNFQSLRAWASAAEGARLTDWLRFEDPSARVLTALLTQNRDGALLEATYRRIQTSIQSQAEAFFAVRSARARVRDARIRPSKDRDPGHLVVSLETNGASLFVTWSPLPPALFEEARNVARANAWRPRLWGVGAHLHPDTALSGGPIRLSVTTPPSEDVAAYPDAAAVFGSGSNVALELAARTVDWPLCLIFEPNDERTQAEQRFTPLTGHEGLVWLATSKGGPELSGLRRLATVCGYRLFEANLESAKDRQVLVQEQLLSDQRQLLLARHPIDAVNAPRAAVGALRPFLLFAKQRAGDPEAGEVRSLSGNTQMIATLPGVVGEVMMRADANALPAAISLDVLLFERDSAFEALIERRLQVRIESSLPIIDLPCSSALEIDGVLIAHGRDLLSSVPATVSGSSVLFAPLYDEAVRNKLLAVGRGILTLAVGRSVSVRVPLQRAPASVEWTDGQPMLVGVNMKTTLASASARLPHRFTPVAAVEMPARGASAFGLLTEDGRIADPVLILISQSFDMGDLSTNFGEDIGSRRRLDGGRGVTEIARARVAWARGHCSSLAAVGAKMRVAKQFEDVLVANLCGQEWLQIEQATKKDATADPYAALWRVALARKLVELPRGTTRDEADAFAQAFAVHARRRNPDWPTLNEEPAEGAMDDALNDAFSDTLSSLHAQGALVDIENDFDFGRPHDDWLAAAEEAIDPAQLPKLVSLIAPSEGASALRRKSYRGLTIPELAEDLAAWSHNWALSRGHLSPEVACSALQLWLSPAACDDADTAVRIIAGDPFVARAVRYVVLRVDDRAPGSEQR